MPLNITLTNAKIAKITVYREKDENNAWFSMRVDYQLVDENGTPYISRGAILHSSSHPTGPYMPQGWQTQLQNMNNALIATIETNEGLT